MSVAWTPASTLIRLYGAIRRGKQAMIDADDLDRELWEIDENLMRAGLKELEHGNHLQRRKEIFEARRSEANCPTSRMNKGFDQDTAEKTGLDKRSVRRSRKRAEKITPEVKEDIKDIPLLERADPAYRKTGPGQLLDLRYAGIVIYEVCFWSVHFPKVASFCRPVVDFFLLDL